MRPVRTEEAPAPVAGAPYSQGVVVDATDGSLVFVSGQVPLDPATGTLVADDVATQTTQCIEHVEAILRAAGSGLDRVIKTTIFLAHLEEDFGPMNEAYRAGFRGHAPARATVGVAALPLGARVEIEAVATGTPG